jgi:hypothetical protein
MFLLLLVTMAFSMVVIVAISFTEKKNWLFYNGIFPMKIR